MAVFYFNHQAIGKRTHQAGTAAAHARYILRRGALEVAAAERMPANYHAVQRFLERREEASRANARVIDKFVVNLPRELDTAQHVRLLRRFLDAVSGGRAPYLFAVHRDRPNHPHAHIIFIDSDPETGRRVFRTSDAGSSFRLRKLWEDICNAELARARHEVTIIRFGKEKAVERGQDATVCTQMHLAPNPLREDFPAGADKESPMDQQQAEIRQEGVQSTLRSLVSFVLAQEDEVSRIVGARESLAKHRADYARSDRDLADTERKLAAVRSQLHAHEQASRIADANLAQHKTRLGRLRGISIGGWKSRARIRAEAAKMQADVALFNLKSAHSKAETLMADARVLEAEKTRLQVEAQGIQTTMGWFGREDEINTAETMLKHTIAVNVADMDTHAITAAFQRGELTPDQYDRICRMIDRQNQRERGRGVGLSH